MRRNGLGIKGNRGRNVGRKMWDRGWKFRGSAALICSDISAVAAAGRESKHYVRFLEEEEKTNNLEIM